MTSPLPTSPVFELVAFLVSGARGAPEEGVYTASLRLIEAAGRLSRMAATDVSDVFLAELGATLRTDASTRYMESTESYVAFLDDVLTSVAREVRRRNGLPSGPAGSPEEPHPEADGRAESDRE